MSASDKLRVALPAECLGGLPAFAQEFDLCKQHRTIYLEALRYWTWKSYTTPERDFISPGNKFLKMVARMTKK